MLSSTSISVANGYTVSFAVTEVNGTVVNGIILPKQYKLVLSDGIAASLARQPYEQEQQPFRIDLFDGIFASYDKKYNDEQNDNKKFNSHVISLQIADGVGTSSIKQHNDERFVKIISIKQDHDRKALWERIFPLDRIRSEKQSLYKVIQDDNGLSHLQVNEYKPEQPEDNEFLLDTPFANDVDKFFGKANYAAEQITDQIKRLTDVDKFIGKSLYVGNQISVNVQHLTDVDKFVGNHSM